MDIQKKLEEHLQKFTSAPFLFVGSGFSRRYIGLEDWEGLLRKFCNMIKPNKKFGYYKSTAGSELEKVAGLMAEDFHNMWWEDDRFESSRDEFGDDLKDSASALRIEISKYLRDKKYEYGISEQNDREIEALKKVVIDGIITTNWDCLLEQIFGEYEYEKFVGQRQLLFANTQEVGELYKIHGCCKEPDSLILTDKDYEDFDEHNQILAAKLLTIFIEHPIIFIGYSLRDKNIQKILKAITSCLTKQQLDKLQDRLIFLQRKEEGDADSFLAGPLSIDGNIITVTTIKTNDFSLVYDALSKNKRKFSARQMRHMKSQLYELVKTNDPEGKLHVVVDSESDFVSSGVEFVIGVGVISRFGDEGYKPIDINRLFEAIVVDTQDFDYEKIVSDTLPTWLKIDGFIPVFKFVKLSGLDTKSLHDLVRRKLNVQRNDFIVQKYRQRINQIRKEYPDVGKIIENFELEKAFEMIPVLERDQIDLTLLKTFIVENLEILNYPNSVLKTNFRRLIRFYDWLLYSDKSVSKKESA